MITGSPVSLTETAVFCKTDFKKKSRIFKNPLIVLPFFLFKAISCDNLAEVAEKNQYSFSRDLTISHIIRATCFLFATMINIDIVRKLGSFE